MLKAKTRWQLADCDEQLAAEIAAKTGLMPLVSRLLVIRGINTPEKVRNFLQPGPEQFHDPFLLDGMEKSVHRIRQAIERKEAICIYGDYDADGVSSTSLMVHLLRQLGAEFDYYVPNRFTEGYGLHNEALTRLQQDGYKLIVTVDTGISAVEQVEHAKRLGLDVIVTDHHEPPAVIPDAYAVVNPKKPGCSYPFDMLAGVGVAFKLGHALLGEPPLHLADLAALGTIADLVPLVDENRILAKVGLSRLNRTQNIGLQALIRVCGLSDTELSAGHVGFALGPRLNAGGRLETAEAAVKLLTTQDHGAAEACAQTLDDLNRERQELVQSITQEAVEIVQQQDLLNSQVLVLAKEGWNVGVVGIVASRLVEMFYRPTLVLGIDPDTGMAKGSARSIAGFDMYEALTACRELLPHYGGHTMAAGMTLPAANLQPLREKLNEFARERLGPEDFIPLTKVDVVLDMDEVSLEAVAQLEQLAPYGMGNPTPLILLRDVQATGMRVIGRDENHLKCTLTGRGTSLDAIGFQWAHVARHVTPKANYHVLGELSVNEWNGNRKPQLIIRDLSVNHQQLFDWRGCRDKTGKWQELVGELDCLTIAFRPENHDLLTVQAGENRHALNQIWPAWVESGEQPPHHPNVILYDLPRRRSEWKRILPVLQQTERIYCLFGDSDLGREHIAFPGRDHFKQLYQFLRQVTTVQKQHLDALARRLKWSRYMVDGIFAVFVELDFVLEDEECYRLHHAPSKKPLESSFAYQAWKEEAELATELLLSSSDGLLQLFHQVAEPVT